MSSNLALWKSGRDGLEIRLKLGPNLLIFSFSSDAPAAHNAGGYYHYVSGNSQQIFLTKEGNIHDTRRISACHMPVLKGSFGCCAV